MCKCARWHLLCLSPVRTRKILIEYDTFFLYPKTANSKQNEQLLIKLVKPQCNFCFMKYVYYIYTVYSISIILSKAEGCWKGLLLFPLTMTSNNLFHKW